MTTKVLQYFLRCMQRNKSNEQEIEYNLDIFETSEFEPNLVLERNQNTTIKLRNHIQRNQRDEDGRNFTVFIQNTGSVIAKKYRSLRKMSKNGTLIKKCTHFHVLQ